MKITNIFLSTVYCLLATVMIGCTVRTYSVTRERVDQDLVSGNRGYIQGSPPPIDTKARRKTRQTQIIEIELGRPVEVITEGNPPPAVPTEQSDPALWGDRELTNERITEKIVESVEPDVQILGPVEKYTVKNGDTLQKISQKYYGTTKKWYKIYQANQDKLTGPDKIYPGEVINVPLEEMKEPLENLK